MTDRRPLVISSGLHQELPAGDNIADPVLAAVAQLCGFTTANIAEVEASTKALRVTWREPASGPDRERAFNVSHHSLGMVVPVNATTSAIAAVNILNGGMVQPAVAILRKMTVGCATSALTGTRTGLISIKLKQYLPIVTNDDFSQWVTPPLGTSSTVSSLTTGRTYNSLKGSQASPIFVMSSLPGQLSIGAAGIASKTLGDVTGDAQATVGGMNIRPTVIFDHLGNAPYTMGPQSGFFVTLDSPAAGTSQTIQCFINVCWTELQPDIPC